MQDNKSGGSRSTYLKLRRALVMFSVLRSGPGSEKELIAAVQEQVGADAYRAAPHHSFRGDLALLRGELCCQIGYHRGEGLYVLEGVNNPYLTLSLSEEGLEALALLRGAFQIGVPHADKVQSLLDYIEDNLPEDQRRALRVDPLLSLSLAPAGDWARHRDKLAIVERAMAKKQQLEFEYLSPQYERPRRHVVEPVGDSLRYREGHLYFEGYPVGEYEALTFRVDRIVPGSAQVLPTRFAPRKRRKRIYTLRYRLSPKVARHDVSERFPGQTVERHEDGSATITAQIDDLFWATRTLLKYGANCQVLEPPELVREMGRVVGEMAGMYDV